MVKCSQCAVESEIEQVFRKERRWFGLRTKLYCPACQKKRTTRSLVITFVCLLLFGAFGLIIVMADPTAWYGWLAIRIFVLFLVTIPLIVIHESAHAVVGHL